MMMRYVHLAEEGSLMAVFRGQGKRPSGSTRAGTIERCDIYYAFFGPGAQCWVTVRPYV
jgi:hypothetical protein